MTLFLIGVNVVVTASGQLVGAAQWQIFILIVNSLLFTFAAFGMHLLVFEEMTYEVRAAATRDELTGCHNRRFLEQVIPHEMQRHRRYRIPLSILFIDIDRFKMGRR